MNIGLFVTDFNFATWLRDKKNLSAEEVLNKYNETELRKEFEQTQQSEFESFFVYKKL
jgi:hypothetical protein